MWLKRPYVPFFIKLEARWVHFAGVTANPDGRWATQQARNLLLVLGERGRRVCYLLHDRDAKFTRSFDDVFGSEDAEVLLTPVQAANANAHAERWVRTVRTEYLDWLLVVGRGHLEQVLRVYEPTTTPIVRTGRWAGAASPSAALRVVGDGRSSTVHRNDLLGGVLHEYHRRAA